MRTRVGHWIACRRPGSLASLPLQATAETCIVSSVLVFGQYGQYHVLCGPLGQGSHCLGRYAEAIHGLCPVCAPSNPTQAIRQHVLYAHGRPWQVPEIWESYSILEHNETSHSSSSSSRSATNRKSTKLSLDPPSPSIMNCRLSTPFSSVRMLTLDASAIALEAPLIMLNL